MKNQEIKVRYVTDLLQMSEFDLSGAFSQQQPETQISIVRKLLTHLSNVQLLQIESTLRAELISRFVEHWEDE